MMRSSSMRQYLDETTQTVHGLIALFQTWRRRSLDRRALAGMCNRSLRDIGITRSDALYEARKPFWRTLDLGRRP
jgi:uncharacterized protein YjiS (DUF1127 family)